MTAVPDASTLEREQRLDDVIAAYLEAVEAGEPLDRADLEAAHPDLAAELALFFANQDHVARLDRTASRRHDGGRSHRRDCSSRDPGAADAAATVPFPGTPAKTTNRVAPMRVRGQIGRSACDQHESERARESATSAITS